MAMQRVRAVGKTRLSLALLVFLAALALSCASVGPVVTSSAPQAYSEARRAAFDARARATASDAAQLCPKEWNAAESTLKRFEMGMTGNSMPLSSMDKQIRLLEEATGLYDVARTCAEGRAAGRSRQVNIEPARPAPAAAPTPAPAVQQRVAVLDLRNEAQLPDSDVGYLGEIVRTGARKALPLDRFILMTKENIYQLLPPERRELRDCEGQCEVETGRLLSADYLVTGTVVRFGGELRVTIRLYDIASGNLLDSQKASGKKVLDLEAPIESVAQTLFEAIRPRR